MINSLEYPKYPIYISCFRFVEEAEENYVLTKNELNLGLKLGERLNAVVFHSMFKHELTNNEKMKFLLNNVRKLNQKYKITDFIESAVIFERYDTWLLRFFCHSTFKIEGKNNNWYLDSFKEYVSRKENENEHAKYNEGYDDLHPKYQLMGAEDKWRWRGEREGDSAPCECSACLDSDLIFINH